MMFEKRKRKKISSSGAAAPLSLQMFFSRVRRFSVSQEKKLFLPFKLQERERNLFLYCSTPGLL